MILYLIIYILIGLITFIYVLPIPTSFGKIFNILASIFIATIWPITWIVAACVWVWEKA